MKSRVEVTREPGLPLPRGAIKLLRLAVERTLSQAEKSGPVSVALVSDARIAELNQRYLGRPGPTDVLAFSLGQGWRAGEPWGEVVISAETARRQAEERGHDWNREIALLGVHGALHLLGRDDDTEAGWRQMMDEGKRILDGLEVERGGTCRCGAQGNTPPGSGVRTGATSRRRVVRGSGAGGLMVLLALLLTCVLGLGGAGCRKGTPPNPAPPGPLPPAAGPTEPQKPCPLCGQPVPERTVHRRPVGIMIDNAPAAYPQDGLGEACLVYEVPAEGGITRFLAFFQHEDAARIGPVRSVRPYFLDLVMPLDAVLGHAGGSEPALADIKSLRVSHLCEIFGGGEAFWRVPPSERKPPHATYTSGQRFRQVMEARGLEKKGPFPCPFTFTEAKDAPPSGEKASTVTVTYAGVRPAYRVTYAYQPNMDRWWRSVNDKEHLDAQGRQLWARNLIVQFVDMHRIPGDELLHMDLEMTGRGRAFIISGDRCREASWQKSSRKSLTVYRDEKGRAVTLRPGPTWVLVVPASTKVEVQGGQ